MKKLFIAMCLGVMAVSTAFAGEAKVTWQEPDNYTDIRPTNETKEAFRDRVFKDLGAVFDDMAKQLPDGVLWDITVTDVDLAGDVRPMMRPGMNDIRIVKEVYWPRMTIQYKMTDASGKMLAEGKEDIKDMNFMMSSIGLSGDSSFQYEERMLRDWFKKQQREQKFPSR